MICKCCSFKSDLQKVEELIFIGKTEEAYSLCADKAWQYGLKVEEFWNKANCKR